EQDPPALLDCLLPIDAGLSDWPVLQLDERGADDVAHGRALHVTVAPGRYRTNAPSGRLLAIGEVDPSGALKVLRVFVGGR
ncbi:MAG: tRNA pseudouridine(55) synthase TruB, partial [Rhodanobacteraceae bacterium]